MHLILTLDSMDGLARSWQYMHQDDMRLPLDLSTVQEAP